jgi:hypothetical protein
MFNDYFIYLSYYFCHALMLFYLFIHSLTVVLSIYPYYFSHSQWFFYLFIRTVFAMLFIIHSVFAMFNSCLICLSILCLLCLTVVVIGSWLTLDTRLLCVGC